MLGFARQTYSLSMFPGNFKEQHLLGADYQQVLSSFGEIHSCRTMCPYFPLSGEVHFQKSLLWDCFLRKIVFGTIHYGFMRKIIKGPEYQTYKAMMKEKCNYWAWWKKDWRDFNNLQKDKWVLEELDQLSPSITKGWGDGQKWASA